MKQLQKYIFFSLACCFHLATMAQSKPNIIYVLVDDMGWGDVGFNGQDKIKTPSIDRMAAEGMVLREHYTGGTVCAPSRCVLMTGKHTGNSTVRGLPAFTAFENKGTDLNPEDVTVAEELKKAGYATAVIGKWGLAEVSPVQKSTGLPLQQGFDYFFGYMRHGAAHHYYPESIWLNNKEIETGNKVKEKQGTYFPDAMTDTALQYISSQKKNPFFLYLTYTIPHYELTVPEESKKQYENLGWPLRKMPFSNYYNDENGHVTYAGMVSRLDTYMKRLMDHLKKEGIAENTLVIFASDNGHEYDNLDDEFFNSNGPFRGHKRDLYEGGIRTPFVAWWPGKIKAGSSSSHISAFWDFLPTACEAAGVKPSDKKIDGISYLPTLLGKENEQKKHDYLYWETNEKQGPMQALRRGDWKIVKFYEKPAQLYNLAKDIGETKNVAKENPAVLKELESLLTHARTPDENYPWAPRQKKSKK